MSDTRIDAIRAAHDDRHGECPPAGCDTTYLLVRLDVMEVALRGVFAALGPASCACAGQQAEVDFALEYVRAALAGGEDER
jgi:hypothetical protein